MANKFHARKTVVGSVTFDSGLEARRFGELQLLERAGVIRNLERQVVFKFHINGVPVKYPSGRQAKYIADFAYFDPRLNRRVVLDVKGVRTDVYKLKKALTEAMYPGTIIEENIP